MRLPIPQEEPTGRLNMVLTHSRDHPGCQVWNTLIDLKINFNAFTAQHALQREHLPLGQLIYDRLKLPSLAFNKRSSVVNN